MRTVRSLAVLVLLAAAAHAAPDGRFDGGPADPLPQPPAAPPAAPVKTSSGESRLWITAPAATSAERSRIADAGVSIEEIEPGRIAGIATAKSAARLRKLGVAFKAVPLQERFRPEDFPAKDAPYHNYGRMASELQGIAAAGKGLASLFSIGTSLEGKKILALRLNTTASGTDKSPKPGIVFMGTHHAREHLSTEVPLLLAKYLVDNRDKPEIAKLLDSRDVYFIPMVNPDGVEFDIEGGSYHMHRKNMRDNGDGTVGVDLNRNYAYGWGGGGASKDPDSETYRGPGAFSEPETQVIRDFVIARKDTLKVLLTYHSYSELILYPWGHTDDPLPDGPALSAYKKMASAMAKMTGYTPEQSSQLYIASGDTTDWAWGALGVFSFTFELTPKSAWGGGFYPGAGAIASTFANNIRPALYLIGLADDPLRAAAEPELSSAAAPPAGGR